MPSIALLSQKGGAGKITLAVHLAVCCGDGLIIDTDKQKSAAGWWREREGELPELVTAGTHSVPKALEATKRWVFTPPRHEEALRAVCAVSDFILIPARPEILDLRAIADTVGLVDNKAAVIVLNSRPPNRVWRGGCCFRGAGGAVCLRSAYLSRGCLAESCLLACFEWGIGCD